MTAPVILLAVPPDRQAISFAVERLISILDALDGDPDLEANGDELDASFPEGGCRGLRNPDEDDEANGDDEPDSDGEPSLGAPERHPHRGRAGAETREERCRHSQSLWAIGRDYGDDRERQEEEVSEIDR